MPAPAAAHARTSRTATDTGRRLVFAALTSLAGLAVLLQGVWAGLFIEYADRPDHGHGWLDVHARGGEIACLLALLATAWALFRLRDRRELLIGAAALTVLLVLVAYVGGLITDDSKDVLIPLHIPLALLAFGLTVGLAARALLARPHPHLTGGP
jgi:ABC-type uncharacterized transport system permease subunit